MKTFANDMKYEHNPKRHTGNEVVKRSQNEQNWQTRLAYNCAFITFGVTIFSINQKLIQNIDIGIIRYLLVLVIVIGSAVFYSLIHNKIIEVVKKNEKT